MVVNAGTRDQPNVVLNWQSFNVSADGSVQFVQPSATAIALNRIFQSDPSRIFGNLSANGQVYLINQNGILFGNPDGTPMQVNVNGLIASTLQINNAAITDGILAPIALDQAAFTGNSGAIQVSSGATLQSADGGRIALFAPTVTNAGHISSPNGQVLLAAGKSVYLQSSDDPNLRGLLVEVDQGGAVSNTGTVRSAQGNITLVGLAVNQSGRVTATTSVTKAGSISLLARDTVALQVGSGGRRLPQATHTGTVEFGAGSVTEVALDQSNATAIDDQPQPVSSITVDGAQIHLDSGSLISAPGSNVILTAELNPQLSQTTQVNAPGASVQIDSGSTIDVSGQTVTVPMERNQVTVQLRGNELRDDPQQRDGVLRGQTVTIDARVGTPLADVSGYIAAATTRTVAERLGNGGAVTITSQGSASLATGATVNLSGGAVNYLPGVVNTTKLIGADGQVYDIGTAPANVTYVGLYGPSAAVPNKWGVAPGNANLLGPTYLPGYTQGLNAGTLQLAARSLSLAATVSALTQRGVFQVTPATAPLMGQLIIGLANGQSTGGLTDYLAPSLWLGNGAPQGSPAAILPIEQLNQAGIGRFALYSDGAITLPAGGPLTLADGTQLALSALSSNLLSSITDHGGKLTVQSSVIDPLYSLNIAPGVTLGNSISLDFSGTWTNDFGITGNPSNRYVNGGTVSLGVRPFASTLVLGHDLLVDVSGGASVNVAGTVTAGNGGSIALAASGTGSTANVGSGLTLRGYAMTGGKGGSLALSFPSVEISGAAATTPGDFVLGAGATVAAANPLKMDASLFGDGGFASYSVNANQGNLLVDSGTAVQAIVSNRGLLPGYLNAVSGTPLAALSTVVYLPDYQRAPASLTLSANMSTSTYFGQLRVAPGATLGVDPLGTVNLQSTGGSLYLDGTVTARGGSIQVAANQLGSQAFDPSFALWLGPQALLDARGIALSQPDGNGNTEVKLLKGGTVNLTSGGYLVAEQGSRIDVSGAAATGDLQTVGFIQHLYGRPSGNQQTMGTAGGTLALNAGEGMVLLGTLAGRGGTHTEAAAELDLVLDRNLRSGNVQSGTSAFPAIVPQILVTTTTADPTSPISFGAPLPTATYDGLARISTNQISSGGFDALNLRSNVIGFDNMAPLALSVARQVTLNAQQFLPTAGRAITISAPSVILQSPVSSSTATSQAGPAALAVNADNIDLIGALGFSHFASVALDSRGDIRLRGVPSTGSLTTNGSLTLQANRVFPATMTSFALNALDASAGSGTINILSNGAVAPANDGLLSAGGSLALNASVINQDGVLEAPLGQINLNARNTLVLGDGSLTSVHASAAQILLGRTVNLADWYYSASGAVAVGVPDQLFGANTQNFPPKGISLSANSLTVSKGATVDYSGGGDAVAWEQIPGPGGSSDALSLANAHGMFAILPAAAGYGPVDPAEFAQWGIAPGAAVTLYQPANGLAAGTYAILPPRYALLPGAYLVKPTSGYTSMDPSQSVHLIDGSTIVAGTNTYLNTGLQAAPTTGFQVYNGSHAYQLAEYHLTSANSYLPSRAAQLALAAPSLPMDAGFLSVTAQGTLALDGTFNGSAASGGNASRVDVSATNLAVVTQFDPAIQATQITAANLEALGAGSLLLGGKRTKGAAGTAVAVQATSVTVGAGVALSLPELLLVGKNSVSVGAGAQLSASGTSQSIGTTYLLTGDSARLLLGNAKGAQMSASYPLGAVPGQQGVVTTSAASVLSTSGSVVVDGARDLVLGGRLLAAPGSTVSLASSHVSLGDHPAAGTGGLVLSNAELAQLANVDLSLKGRTGIDATSALTIGVDNLVLDAPIILGAVTAPGDTAAFTASGALTLRNTSGTTAAATAPALVGSLSLGGKTVTMDNANVALAGFSTTQLTASSSLLGKGTGALVYQGDLHATTPLLTLADGANLELTAVSAAGKFRLDAPAAASIAATTAIGGALHITANTIEQFGNIELLGGTVDLIGANGVTLGSGSYTSAAGYDVVMPGLTTPVSGGLVSLQSGAGNVLIQSGATVNVAGSSGGSDAGTLALASDSGLVGIDAASVLKGGVATAGAMSGSFSLDAAALANGNFTTLNTQLNAGSFNGRRGFRFTGATPSMDLAAGTNLALQGFSLTVEQGGINIAGDVTVSNAAGKAQLGLYARDTVHVAATGQLAASSQARGTTEAEIDLYSTSGGITVDSGASLSASAPNSTLSTGGGIVHYRLTQGEVAAGGLRVAAGAAAAGTHQLVEGYQAYALADGIIDTKTQAVAANAVYQNAKTFMASAPVLALQAAGYEVAPGVELTSAGDMSLSTAWDLSHWRFGGEPGVLTLRASGSLTFASSLSDGFASAAPTALLGSDRSWSYNLVAGANLASANPLTTAATSPGTVLAIGPDALVRTGTGDIHVASAGDVALLGSVSPEDPYGQGVLYTAGRGAGLELDHATAGARATKFLPVDGGSLTISAKQDVVGSSSDNEFTQFFVEWYLRQPAHARQPGGIWVDYANFQQQFAAFGGGDLSISAGRDLVRVAASVPSTATVNAATGVAQYHGSGSLMARAGADISSGLFLVSRGTGTIEAGGSLTATSTGPYGGTDAAGLLLAAMDSQYTIKSRGDAVIGGVINPTSVYQVGQASSETAYFLSYSDTAKLAITSTTGDVTLQGNALAGVNSDVSGAISIFSTYDLSVLPGQLAVSALSGNVQILNPMYLAPGPNAGLLLAAQQDIVSNAEFSISDVSPSVIATIAHPDLAEPTYLPQIYSNTSGTSAHAVPTLHGATSQVARMIAATGDITGGFWFINEPGLVFAGRDITDMRYNGENINATDVTRVIAGRDIAFSSANPNFGINLDGPGSLQVVAGRNINLGPSYGIVTEGNLVNPGLADSGASITVMTGVSGDIDATLAAIPADQTIADLFLALRTSGRAVANGTAPDFQAGFNAIDTVFPPAQAAGEAGDLTMVQSRIYTLDGGDINIVVPHGTVNVGAAQAAAGGVTKLPSQLGIVAEKAGAVRAFVDGDFLVNASRVFTLGGGDILIWSSNGNIDAGRGAKTTISAPEPTITIDPQGNVQQNFGAAIAGSGIRGILAVPDVAPGDVDLYAPRGFVSAGDAGIGSAGNVTIAAVRVIGADNINFGGTAVGVPVDTGGLGASLASVSAASSSATNTASDAGKSAGGDQGRTPLAQDALSWLEVFVLGLGEDNCRPDDLECLKRQKKALN
jgi:filamentous hemagglutinin family protein